MIDCYEHNDDGWFQHHVLTIIELIQASINRETLKLNDIINQMNVTDIYRALHWISNEFTLFAEANVILPQTDDILGYKENLNKNLENLNITLYFV